MDKLCLISCLLFATAELFALVSVSYPDWIITNVGGSTRIGLTKTCMTLYNRTEACYQLELCDAWYFSNFCIFCGIFGLTAEVVLLTLSHWDMAILKFAKWVGFSTVILFCLASIVFPVGFSIDEIGGVPYQLPNNFQVGLSYIFFIMALWITAIAELFVSKLCLPHF